MSTPELPGGDPYGVAGRPRPALDAVSSGFWEGTAIGEIRYQECPLCGHRQFYPRGLCTACGAEPAYRTSSGRGIVHTFTVIRQNGAKPFRALLPYVVAMIELDEGPRMMGNVVDCGPEDVSIGLVVEAFTVSMDEDIALPFWRPVPGIA